MLLFVLGPGGLREAPGGPGKGHGWFSGPSRGPRSPRDPVKKPKNPYLLQGPTERPRLGSVRVGVWLWKSAARSAVGGSTWVPGVYGERDLAWAALGPPGPSNQGPEKHTNITYYFPETGFDVLLAVPGRRATFHDWFPIGFGPFLFRRSGIRGVFFMWHSLMCFLGP